MLTRGVSDVRLCKTDHVLLLSGAILLHRSLEIVDCVHGRSLFPFHQRVAQQRHWRIRDTFLHHHLPFIHLLYYCIWQLIAELFDRIFAYVIEFFTLK